MSADKPHAGLTKLELLVRVVTALTIGNRPDRSGYMISCVGFFYNRSVTATDPDR
jgi:hypothetical protein